MSLEIRNTSKFFGRLKALDNVSLQVESGSLVCFLGPSGCGKTTLLRVISGLLQPDEGVLFLDGRNLLSVPARKRNFGMVFQSYSLFPNMTIAANVAYGLESRKWQKSDIAERVKEILFLVHLEDQALKYPHQLSGGQQQRVALARALAPKPSMLLLDEPLSALDAKVREELRDEIKTLQNQLRITTIMVTHDQEEALTLSDKLVVMCDGKIIQEGSPMDVYQNPANSFVARFIGRMNVLPASTGIPYSRNGHTKGAVPNLLGIRPEHVYLTTNADSESVFKGTVMLIRRLGNLTRVILRLDHIQNGKGPIRITAEMPGQADGLMIGHTRYVSMPPPFVRILEWE